MVVLVTHERPYYLDRTEAGRQLAVRLGGYQGNCVVFGVPNGGMPVAAEIARRLGADLDAVVVRKLPIPFNPEAGYGAMANDGLPVYNRP
ncbi:MAG: phosphoribosyl transferase, partial [Chloroflexi bacterium]|nr:phosphoribosyl transferase [Chloroflexota bacterium]